MNYKEGGGALIFQVDRLDRVEQEILTASKHQQTAHSNYN